MAGKGRGHLPPCGISDFRMLGVVRSRSGSEIFRFDHGYLPNSGDNQECRLVCIPL